MYKIATWNVNSINVRTEHIALWLERNDVDVLAIQETKCLDENFPFEPFFELGYEVVVSGQKNYNGVALLSRSEATDIITDVPGYDDPQRRILAATVDGIRIINLYVPNGQAVGTEKYEYKLRWLEEVTAFIAEQKERYSKVVVLGDFNIAPTELDVWDPKEWQGCILVSHPERTALNRLLRLGFTDSFRIFNHQPDRFSWWDYRSASFRQNKGLRIDLILLSSALVNVCQNSTIDTAPRTWERPSDHAPAFVVLKEATKLKPALY